MCILVNSKEFEEIKRFSKLLHQTQSDFIRTTIWKKIRGIDELLNIIRAEKNTNKGEDNLRLTELKKIRELLEKLD